MKKYTPKCIADMKDPKCHFYVRIYEKSIYIDTNKVSKKFVEEKNGFKAGFATEVKANFIEWFQNEYRLTIPFKGKKLDFIYPDVAKYIEYEDYIFVLIIKVEKGFKSKCI